jgi:peptide/nickel transport system substrate-binding protein
VFRPVAVAAGLVLAATLTALASAGCSNPSDLDRMGGAADSGAGSIVLADPYEDPTLNPLLGFGDGTGGKFYEGLVDYQADLSLRPKLATELPTASADGLTWTAKLRGGVKYHDGSTFDAADVVRTYETLLDKQSAATIASEYAMLEGVTADGDTVTFRLKYPYASFPHLLTLGIPPSEALEPGASLEESPLNSKPIGTGPYELAEWRKGDRLVMKANDAYWGERAKLHTVTVVFVPDDNTRAQRMRNGDFDGTVLPPALAKGFENAGDFNVYAHKSADHREVMLPMKHKVTGDLAIRRALNLAVNRQGMVDAILAGYGTPASGPVPEAMQAYANPQAGFAFDPDEAKRLLDAAGWRTGDDGIRVKNGVKASFTLMYPPTDSVRKALATAVASDAKQVGIEVELAGLGWDAIQPRMAEDALLMGGGTPFDADRLLYTMLHSSHAEDGYNNPGSYKNAKVDQALDQARQATDETERAKAYQGLQAELIKDPPRVFLVFLEHTYVVRGKWNGYQPVVDPHTHGAVGWGPWWNLEAWQRAS